MINRTLMEEQEDFLYGDIPQFRFNIAIGEYQIWSPLAAGGSWITMTQFAEYEALSGDVASLSGDVEQNTIDISNIAEAQTNADAFTIVIMPDTQFLVAAFYADGNAPPWEPWDVAKKARFEGMIQWILDNETAENIKMVVHTGDMTHHNETWGSIFPDDVEYERIKPYFDQIDDAGIPFLLCPGNHEYDLHLTPRTLNAFNYYFPDTRYTDKEYDTGQYEAGKSENAYYKLDIQGQEYLFLSTEFLPSTDVLAWCNTVAVDNPNAVIFYFTHEYLNGNEDTGLGVRSSGTASYYNLENDSPVRCDGVTEWSEFVQKHKNVTAVYSAHYAHRSSALASTGDSNSIINQFCNDYSYEASSLVDDSLILVRVNPEYNTVTTRVYSPTQGDYLHGYAQDYTFNTKPVYDLVPTQTGNMEDYSVVLDSGDELRDFDISQMSTFDLYHIVGTLIKDLQTKELI